MTATLAALLVRTRDRLNEYTPRHWQDPVLRRFINEGAREVAREAECLLGTGMVAVTAGVRSYSLAALSPQPIRIHRVEYTPTGDTSRYPLTYREITAMDQLWGQQQSVSTGIPSIWTGWGFFPQFTLSTYPTVQSNGTLTLYYYRNPVALLDDGSQDTSVVECPDGWEDCIVDYAEYRGLRNDNRSEWQNAKTEFDQRLQSLISSTRAMSDDTAMIITPGGMSAIPAWLAYGDGY